MPVPVAELIREFVREVQVPEAAAEEDLFLVMLPLSAAIALAKRWAAVDPMLNIRLLHAGFPPSDGAAPEVTPNACSLSSASYRRTATSCCRFPA